MKSKINVGLVVVLSSVMLLNNVVFAQTAPEFHKISSDRASYLQFAFLPVPSEVSETRDILIPNKQKPAAHQVEIQAERIKTTTEKLAVLADALFEQKVRGLAKQKLDDFTTNYLTAAAVELTEWLYDTNEDKDFKKLFRETAPTYLVFSAMSPASMHEYMNGSDMPGLPTGVMEAKKLPVRMCVKKIGDNLLVELWGARDLSLTFKINAHNKVELIG